MKGLLIAAAVGIAALSAGCAGQPKLDFREYAGEPVKSFYMPQLDGWAAVLQPEGWRTTDAAELREIVMAEPDQR